LSDWNPDKATVIIDAPRMIDIAFTQGDGIEQLSGGGIKHKQVADA